MGWVPLIYEFLQYNGDRQLPSDRTKALWRGTFKCDHFSSSMPSDISDISGTLPAAHCSYRGKNWITLSHRIRCYLHSNWIEPFRKSYRCLLVLDLVPELLPLPRFSFSRSNTWSMNGGSEDQFNVIENLLYCLRPKLMARRVWSRKGKMRSKQHLECPQSIEMAPCKATLSRVPGLIPYV